MIAANQIFKNLSSSQNKSKASNANGSPSIVNPIKILIYSPYLPQVPAKNADANKISNIVKNQSCVNGIHAKKHIPKMRQKILLIISVCSCMKDQYSYISLLFVPQVL